MIKQLFKVGFLRLNYKKKHLFNSVYNLYCTFSHFNATFSYISCDFKFGTLCILVVS